MSGSSDNSIKVWNASTFTLIETLNGHVGTVKALDFNADRNLIVSGAEDSDIIIWNSTNYKKIKTLNNIQAIDNTIMEIM